MSRFVDVGGKNPTLHNLVDDPFEPIQQINATAVGGQDFDAEMHFEDVHGGRPAGR